MLITFQAETAEELREKVKEFIKVFGLASSETSEAETTPAKKQSRPRVKKEADESSTVTADQTQPTRTEVLAALQEVNTEKSFDRAKELLSEFNCGKLSDLKEDQYSSFVAACKRVIAE